MYRMHKSWPPWISVLVIMLTLIPMTSNSETFVTHELVLGMEEGYSPAAVLEAFPGADVVQTLEQLDIDLLAYSTSADLDEVAAAIEAMPEVEFCHPNYLIDPLQPVQSSLPISDAAGGDAYYDQKAVERLQLPAVHAFSKGSGVKVAVLDGGVNHSHPDLEVVTSSGWDYVSADGDAFDEFGGANSGHGTFVAGVVHLVAPEAEIVAYRVTDVNGASDGYLVAEAILQAVEDGCQVINLSMVTYDVHRAISQALQYAWDNGVLSVAAAGNGNTSAAHYPASDANSLGVAAVDTDLSLADFSSFGEHVDICAPGTDIYAPYQDQWAWWGGTSFSAPFVSAHAALLISMFPMSTVADVKEAMISSAINIDHQNVGYEGQLGYGALDMLGSLSDHVCGNVNGDPAEQITLTDITYLMSHLYLIPAELPARDAADVDDWEGLSGNDVAVLSDYLYRTHRPLDCDPSNTGSFPVSATTRLELRDITIPSGNDNWKVELWLDPAGGTGDLVVPFTLGGSPVSMTVDSIVINPFTNYPVTFAQYDAETRIGLVAGHSMGADTPEGYHKVADLYLGGTGSSETQNVHIDTCVYSENVKVVFSLDGGWNPVTPSMIGFGGNSDADGDGVNDNVDNCVSVSNPGQEDDDGDGVGNVCDLCAGGDDFLDDDSDGMPDACDNCPTVANLDQLDDDLDGIGNACDPCTAFDDSTDTDLDGQPDECDNCPELANPDQIDLDLDGIGDDCDPCVAFNATTDTDDDGWPDECDNCPQLANPDQIDSDGDGIGDLCEGAQYHCGNVNADPDDIVSIIDFTALVDHLLISKDDLPEPSWADVDDWEGLTVNDACVLAGAVFAGRPVDCQPDNIPPYPASTSDSVVFTGLTIPAGSDNWEITVYAKGGSLSGLCIPFSFSCTNPSADIEEIVQTGLSGCPHLPVFITEYDAATSEGMISLLYPNEPCESGLYRAATIVLSNTYSPTDEDVHFDILSSFPPSNTFLWSEDYGSTAVVPVAVTLTEASDSDEDGICDIADNCPDKSNHHQIDSDYDGIGNMCDQDDDNDGIIDTEDNCQVAYNPDQEDLDGNGLGDVCEQCCGLYTGGLTGNADCSADGKLTLADIVRLVDRVYMSKQSLCCEGNGNVDGDASGVFSLSDIGRLVDAIYISKNETAPCQNEAIVSQERVK